MTRRRFLLAALLGAAARPASAQTFKPQSPTGLTVTFTTERAGGSRVIVFGEVKNATGSAADHVVVLAEGLDDSGRVVSRGRGYVGSSVPARGTSPFELRFLASGSEKRYRVQIESFEFSQIQGN
jgi:hypothetical protein